MMKAKKLACLLLAGALSFSVLAGCGPKAGSSNEILVGLNYELSGDVATYGQSSVEGIKLAIKQINDAGGVLGKKLILREYDNKSDAAEATSIATKLATRDKVIAVLGPATSGNVKAVTPVVTKNKIPLLSGSATAEDVTVDESGKVKEFIFRNCFIDSFQGSGMAGFATKTLNAKKAVVLVDNNVDYSKGLAKDFKATFTKSGGEIVAEEAFNGKETDFNSVLTKIKSMDFDVIFLPAYYEAVGLIVKQARALGIDKPILGGDGYDSPKLVDIAGKDALNKVYFSNHYSAQDTDPAVVSFIEAFKKEYKKDPNAFNALGFDMAYFLKDAIERAGSADSVKIKDAFASTKNFKGITGELSVDEKHNPVKAITVLEYKDGVVNFNQKIAP